MNHTNNSTLPCLKYGLVKYNTEKIKILTLYENIPVNDIIPISK